MPPAEVEQVLLEIAGALEYAHERGVIHRDLKPANIKIDPEDKVKILDFGLAKALTDPASSSGDPTDSPTVTMGGTIAGTILGTAAYMSPEQARGKKVDKRADIWAFGVVAWEMLTGERLFKGEDTVQVLGRVLEQPLEFDRVPPRFRKLLERCLDRNVKDRLRDIGEARFLIQRSRDREGAAEVVTSTAPSRSRLRWLPWAVAAMLAVALGIIAYRHSTEEAPRLLRSTVPLPEKAILSPVGLPAVSPDGRHIAYVATVDGKAGLWVRDLDAPAPRLLIAEDANYPFWSPDSRSIAFGSLGKLKRVEVSGGPALTLCDAALFRGGTWSQNDVILFSLTRIFRVSAAGGAPAQVTTVDQDSGTVGHFFPWFLPDGRHFLYLADIASEQSALYVGDLDFKERKRLQLTQYNAVYASGYLLFLRERTLMAQRFDTGKLETTGDAVPIAEQVDTGGAPNRAYFSASQNGVLAFTSGALAAQITWLDRSGKPAGTIGGPGDIRWTAISPDGKTVAFDRMDEQTGKYNIWLHAVAGGADSRFTFNSKNNRYPVWSQPDGASIAFTSDQAGHLSAYRKAVGGSGKEEAVDADALVKLPTDWSAPDGRYVIEQVFGVPNTGVDIWVAPVTRNGEKSGGEKPRPYLQTEFNEGEARVSPNGKWLAYRSDETKRNEVYVMTFPNPGGKWQISTNGGSLPVWSRDGKELFFVSADNKMMAVDIRGTGANPEPGVPHPLFEVRLGPNNPRYDVAKDGRFLAPLAADQAAGGSINVVVNWMAGLKK